MYTFTEKLILSKAESVYPMDKRVAAPRRMCKQKQTIFFAKT